MRNWKELLASTTSLRLGIDNTPKDEVTVKNLIHSFIQFLKIQKQFPKMILNSGFRCFQLNVAVGGERYSQHLTGCALDLDYPSDIIVKKDLPILYEWIKNNIDYDKLIQEHFPYGWIHVSFRPEGGNRKINLEKVTGVPGYRRIA